MRKNRVADWCDLTDLLYSQLSELCAHNRKVNMNQFSERFPNKVWDVNTADVLMIRCLNVFVCPYAQYIFHLTQRLWAIDWMYFCGNTFGISVFSRFCQSVHSCPLITAAICVSLCYRKEIWTQNRNLEICNIVCYKTIHFARFKAIA